MYTFDPGTSEAEEANLYEFEATMVYIVSSRPVRLHGETLSQNRRRRMGEERERILKGSHPLHEEQEGAPAAFRKGLVSEDKKYHLVLNLNLRESEEIVYSQTFLK